MLEFLLCVTALIVGPLVYQVTSQKARTYAVVDGFVLVGVGGLILLEVLPGTINSVGLAALPVALAGFVFPYLLESRLNSLPVSPRTILSTLIVLGLLLHQLLDGVALHDPAGHHGHDEGEITHLVLAVILHQLPKGFFLWELVRKARGAGAAMVVIAALVAATGAGYSLGSEIVPALEGRGLLLFQAFIAGGLLHVVVHHVPGRDEFARRPVWSGLGAVGALGLFLFQPEPPLVAPASETALGFREVFLSLAAASSLPILLGLLAAGALHAFAPVGSVRLFQGRNRATQALRGIVVGAPLPICSCGVMPLYKTLIHRGVPVAAGLAFLISTPEIGFDSLFLSFRLLGWEITLVRLTMAFTVALATGAFLGKLLAHPTGARAAAPSAEAPLIPDEKPRRGRLREALRFGCVEMLDDIGAWLVAGLVLAAAIEPYIQPEWVRELPQGVDILALSLCGLPLYVCASGATPLAAVFLSKGISTGAVLAFLITGPTTNVTTFGVLSRMHGAARAMAFVLTVFVLAASLGLAVNLLGGASMTAELQAHATGSPSLLDRLSALALGALLLLSVLRLGPRGFLARLGVRSVEPREDHDH